MCDPQAHKEEGPCVDSFALRTVPIIVVPGVAGSRLRLGQGPHWDPDTPTDMLRLAAMGLRPRAEHLDHTNNRLSLLEDLPSTAATAIGQDTELQQLADIWLRPQGNPWTPSFAAQRVYQSRGWGTVAWGTYGPILLCLEKALNAWSRERIRYPVYAVGYDWRQSNRDSGNHLSVRIDQILRQNPGATRVVIVSHSMGGLVTRAAVHDGAGPRILGIVHTVMPSAGAVQHYRRFHTGFDRTLDASGDVALDLGFGRIIGWSNGPGYALIMSRLRGPMELLPTPAYPQGFLFWTPPGGTMISNLNVANNLWDEYSRDSIFAPGIVPPSGESAQCWHDPVELARVLISFGLGGLVPAALAALAGSETIQTLDRRLLQDRISQARTFYEDVFANETPHPNTYILYSSDVTTDVQYDWNQRDPARRPSQMRLGDGTVPNESAVFSRCTTPKMRTQVSGIRHSTCFASDSFCLTTKDYVRLILQRAVCQTPP